MNAELLARLQKRHDMHAGHPVEECTETISYADFDAILRALSAAQEYADAYRRWHGSLPGGGDYSASAMNNFKAKRTALLAEFPMRATEETG